jgi:hypothetical protein
MSRIHFPFGWYAWDLGEYRPFPQQYLTYWLFAYEQLPPLPPPDPTFRFLGASEVTTGSNPDFDASRAWVHRQLATLTDAAARLGLTLPEGFVSFMCSPELQVRLRSGGGFGFMLSSQVVPCPGFDGGYLVGFLCDQQECVIWCLCLTRDGQSCVVAVPSEVFDAMTDSRRDALLGMLEPEEIEGVEELASGRDERDASWEAATASGGICICALSFASFIYRFWIENEIGWKLNGNDQTPLTDAERGYVEHYAHMRHIAG